MCTFSLVKVWVIMVQNVSPIRENRYKEIYACVQASGGVGVALKEVAECLKVKPTPYIGELLSEMVGYGWLRREWSMGKRMHYRWFVVEHGKDK
jgi:hypothetical protein